MASRSLTSSSSTHDPNAIDFVQPLRELGEPILDLVGPNAYVDVQQVFDPNLPKGPTLHFKGTEPRLALGRRNRHHGSVRS